MSLLYLLGSVSVIVLGIITSLSDIRTHKAYNRHILPFFIIGITIQVCTCIAYHELSVPIIMNTMTTVVVSFLSYLFQIWAAGDAKLFIAMVLCIPYPVYSFNSQEVFPAFYILCIVFSLGFLYVIIETVFLIIRDLKNHRKMAINCHIFKINAETVISWAMGFLTADTANCVMQHLFGTAFFENNLFVTIIINLLIVTTVLSGISNRRTRLVMVFVLITIRGFMGYQFEIIFTKISPWLVLIVTTLMFLRKITSQYNYQSVPTAEVKEGQILAKSSLLYMVPSSVKNIPKWTDETTRCRLTSEEVAAIHRWEKSKYGQSTVTVVRHIPFAPFIFLGILLFLMIRVYIGGS